MKITDLDYTYPEELIGTEPQKNFRAMLVDTVPHELNSRAAVIDLFRKGDILFVNDTQVLKRRIHTESGLEVLFLKSLGNREWEVLYPVRKSKFKNVILPMGIEMELLEKGRPQRVRVSEDLGDEYFNKWGELALPPYIQRARGVRKNKSEDQDWYQTDWAQIPGSYAAPTASLHFNNEDLKALSDKGVKVLKVTLHVGLGTFLPVVCEDLKDHKMHHEWVSISKSAIAELQNKEDSARVWALGTTVARSLEAWHRGDLKEDQEAQIFYGETDIFITPGFKFNVVDVLMTNFHQPKSTLLALVAGFSSLEKVKFCYEWAIKKKFKLFSYGDFSIWM